MDVHQVAMPACIVMLHAGARWLLSIAGMVPSRLCGAWVSKLFGVLEPEAGFLASVGTHLPQPVVVLAED